MTSERKNIYYILPHHDDEMFVIPKIMRDLKENHQIKFFFLMESDLRMKESVKFLTRLGVKGESIISIGKKLKVPDGSIHLFMDEIYSTIMATANSEKKLEEIVCTAFEGGHNDHDSASLIARNIAGKFNATVFEFYLYNGHGTRGKFYKVASPVNLVAKVTISYSWRDLITVLRAPFIFASQLSAMIGLWPFLMLKILMFKPLTLNRLLPGQLEWSDFGSAPLYERWGRITQSEFNTNKNDFIRNISK